MNDRLSADAENENLKSLEQVAEKASGGRGKVIEAGEKVKGKVETERKAIERSRREIESGGRITGDADGASGRRKESEAGRREAAESAKAGTEENAIEEATEETANEDDASARGRQSPNLPNQKHLRQTQLKFSGAFKRRRCAGRARNKRRCSGLLTHRKRKEKLRRKDSVWKKRKNNERKMRKKGLKEKRRSGN